MKIYRFLAGVLGLLLLFSGCTSAKENREDERLSVVTTNFAMYDLARAVAGELCTVTMLVPPGAESHDFEATLGDIAKVAEADVFVYVGSEDWVQDTFAAMGEDAESMVTVNAMDLILHKGSDLLTEEVCTVGEEHDHHEDEMDEHVWTSMGNAKVILDGIAEAIIEKDESLAEGVLANRDAYAARLDVLDASFYALAEGTEQTLVFADRFPFAYMTKRYGFAYQAAFSGCTSDTEPSLSVIAALAKTVKEENLAGVLVIEFSDQKTARAIAAETGCEIFTLHSGQTVSAEDFEKGITLADLMEENLTVLEQLLGANED